MKYLWWAVAVVALGFVVWAVSMMLGIGTAVAGTSSSTSSNGWTTSDQGTPEDEGTGDGTWVGAVWDAGPGYVLSVWEALASEATW